MLQNSLGDQGIDALKDEDRCEVIRQLFVEFPFTRK